MREAGHIEVDVQRLDESAQFYGRVTRQLGWSRRFSGAHAVMWGPPDGTTGLVAIGPIEGEEVAPKRGPAGIIFAERRQLERIAAVTIGFAICSRHEPYLGLLQDLDGNELLLVEDPTSQPRGLAFAVPITEVARPLVKHWASTTVSISGG